MFLTKNGYLCPFSYPIKYKCFRLPPGIFHIVTLTISLTLFPPALLQEKWAWYTVPLPKP